MLNRTGVLAVMDHGVTLNWEDGPTLHRMTAQVRYHTATSATQQLMRVQATQPYDELTFVEQDVVRAAWSWQELNLQADEMGSVDYWVAQLDVTNTSDETVYLDTLDVISIESAYSGQLNLGASPGQWRCARETPDHEITWQALSDSTLSNGEFADESELLLQPSLSNRSKPPALLIRVLRERSSRGVAGQSEAHTSNPREDTDPQPSRGLLPQSEEHTDIPREDIALQPNLPTEIKLEISGGRFARLVARLHADGYALAAGDTLTSARFLVISGDDAGELRTLAAKAEQVR